MMRYGFSATCRSFTTAGGGPAAGHAWRRAPPLQAASAMAIPLRTTTRVDAAMYIDSPPSKSIRTGVIRRRAAREPVAEPGRFLGQAPLLEDRERHGTQAAFA